MQPLREMCLFLLLPLCCLSANAQDQTPPNPPKKARVHKHQPSSTKSKGANASYALRIAMVQNQGGDVSSVQNCGITGTLPQPVNQQFGQYYERFGANFDVAASFGDAGANGIPSAQNSIQTETLGQVEFESDHFGYHYKNCPGASWSPTFSYGGSFGLRPALVMENLTSTTATISNPNARPMFQDAFGWTLGPKLNFATSAMSQLAIFTNLGENYLISQVTSFKEGDDTITATPVSNEVGQSAMFWETGIEWKYLNTDLATAYIDKTDALAPPFTISFGYKQDSRFKQAGDLVSFTDAERRMFFRFSIGLNKIVGWNGNAVSPGKGYTFKFGVDYEHPLGTSKMPTSTRYYVSANIDLMKVFKPQSSCSTPSAPTGLEAAAASATQINLTWSASSSSCAITYEIFRDTTAGFSPSDTNQIATQLTATSYSDADKDLKPNTTYYYYVRAEDSAGDESGNSNQEFATTKSQ